MALKTGTVQKAGAHYTVRSNLSHAGRTDILDVQPAKELAELVLNQAVLKPSLLDVPRDSGTGATN
ncbi:hypothetical protein WS68_18610 [Burkholderia sp. TSV86]|nr:hypothetical protein WS68_18610 [Burkholderia sp. TSV86]